MTSGAPAPALAGARVYLVTGEKRGRDLEASLSAALAALPEGGAAVQVRAKDLDSRALLEEARRAIDVAHPRGVPVLVNDRLDVALAAGADGVHLPEAGLGVDDARRAAGQIPILVGKSTHAAGDAAAAARAGADLVVLGPIFDTPSKAALGMAPLGEGALREAADALVAEGSPARLFAIGGITGAREAAWARAAGAQGVAAIRAGLGARDPAAAASSLYAAAAGA